MILFLTKNIRIASVFEKMRQSFQRFACQMFIGGLFGACMPLHSINILKNI